MTRSGSRISRTTILILSALIALIATAFFGSQAATGSDASDRGTNTETVFIRGAKGGPNGLKLFFDPPKTIASGDILKIRSLTDGKNVGPHTFSLVKPAFLPTTKVDRQKCFTPGRICFAIAKWQGLTRDGKVGKNPGEAGQKGWDFLGGPRDNNGDSWFAGSKPGNEFKQVVSAKPGTTLSFLCAVHPNMNGQIRVTN